MSTSSYTQVTMAISRIYALTIMFLALCIVVSAGSSGEQGEAPEKQSIEELLKQKMPLFYDQDFGEDNPTWVFSECRRLHKLGFFKHDVYRAHEWAIFRPECDEDGNIVSMEVSRLAVAARLIIHLNWLSSSAKEALVENQEPAAFLSRFLIEYRKELSALATRKDVAKWAKVRGDHALLLLRALGAIDGRISSLLEETDEY